MSEEQVKGKKMATDADLDNITKTSAELLREMPKVKVKIYLSVDDRKKLESDQAAGKKVVWPYELVGVNGHNYQILRGIEVEVPQTVAEILEEAGLI